jgi:hypothetical protein
MRYWLLFFLLLATPAWATGTWDKSPATGENDCDFTPIKGEDRVCFCDLDALDETCGLLITRVCENITVKWVSNIADATYTNHLEVRWANDYIAENLFTSEVVGGAALTGDPVTSLDSLYGFDAPAIWVKKTVHSGGIGRVSVQCHPAR